jgi:hypothetical protein
MRAELDALPPPRLKAKLWPGNQDAIRLTPLDAVPESARPDLTKKAITGSGSLRLVGVRPRQSRWRHDSVRRQWRLWSHRAVRGIRPVQVLLWGLSPMVRRVEGAWSRPLPCAGRCSRLHRASAGPSGHSTRCHVSPDALRAAGSSATSAALRAARPSLCDPTCGSRNLPYSLTTLHALARRSACDAGRRPSELAMRPYGATIASCGGRLRGTA